MADPRQTKRSFLRENGTLNPRPQAVKSEIFRDSDFFDTDDLLQVKYEMLRLVEVDKQSVSEAVKVFGFSRRPSIRHRQHFRTPVSPACCRTNAVRDPGTS
jgi:hypothetical protein